VQCLSFSYLTRGVTNENSLHHSGMWQEISTCVCACVCVCVSVWWYVCLLYHVCVRVCVCSRCEGDAGICGFQCTEDTGHIHSVVLTSAISTAVESQRHGVAMMMFAFPRQPNETSAAGWCPRDNIATVELSQNCLVARRTYAHIAGWLISRKHQQLSASMWLNWHDV